MTIYLVTVNGRVSQVAYKTLEEAQAFVYSRVNTSTPKDVWEVYTKTHPYVTINHENVKYQILDVRVK